jgi:hypothetical protein
MLAWTLSAHIAAAATPSKSLFVCLFVHIHEHVALQRNKVAAMVAKEKIG